MNKEYYFPDGVPSKWKKMESLESEGNNLNLWRTPGALVVKNLPASVGDRGDPNSIPESGRFPGGENGSPLQYSGLENPMDRGAWRVTVVKSQGS